MDSDSSITSYLIFLVIILFRALLGLKDLQIFSLVSPLGWIFCKVGPFALLVSLSRCGISKRGPHIIRARDLRPRPAKLETRPFVSAHALQLRPEAMSKWSISHKAKARLGKNPGPSQSGPQHIWESSSLSCIGQNSAGSVQAVRCGAFGVGLASGRAACTRPLENYKCAATHQGRRRGRHLI